MHQLSWEETGHNAGKTLGVGGRGERERESRRERNGERERERVREGTAGREKERGNRVRQEGGVEWGSQG